MEAFTLLKYWRTAGATGGTTTPFFTGDPTFTSRAATETIATPYTNYGEDGPYFDLEFSLPHGTEPEKAFENKEPSETTESENGSVFEESSDYENDDYDEDLKYISLTNEEITNQKTILSPFFQDHLAPIDEPSNKSPVSLLKSAANFRILLLKLKKSKSENGVLEESDKSKANEDKSMFAVKFKVDEVKGSFVSLFSSRENNQSSKQCMQNPDERKLSTESVQKYLNMLKPLYVRVSSHYGEKMKSPPSKYFSKSRSTSAVLPNGKTGSDRRDDSLLELHDGIQGAILHCKRSFNASRDGGESAISE